MIKAVSCVINKKLFFEDDQTECKADFKTVFSNQISGERKESKCRN